MCGFQIDFAKHGRTVKGFTGDECSATDDDCTSANDEDEDKSIHLHTDDVDDDDDDKDENGHDDHQAYAEEVLPCTSTAHHHYKGNAVLLGRTPERNNNNI